MLTSTLPDVHLFTSTTKTFGFFGPLLTDFLRPIWSLLDDNSWYWTGLYTITGIRPWCQEDELRHSAPYSQKDVLHRRKNAVLRKNTVLEFLLVFHCDQVPVLCFKIDNARNYI